MNLDGGNSKMFEIFFFVNPIGINCYQNEQEIIAAVSGYKQNISYHFIPMTTMNTIRNDIRARHLYQVMSKFLTLLVKVLIMQPKIITP